MNERVAKRSVYQPKKNLGQNFLTEQRVLQKIVQACSLGPDDTVVEIGPGQGALTGLIAPLVKTLTCVETDRDLIEPLHLLCHSRESGNPVQIVHADFLKWQIPVPCKIIGNIPYYISTPIIEKLIQDREKVSEAYLTVQWEFGQRLAAAAGGKDYGSLSCFAQYYADIQVFFKIKNTCFKPAPKVDSCFLKMTMRPPAESAWDEVFLFRMIQTAFQQRRKTIINTLKGLVAKEKLQDALMLLKIQPNSRPETITLTNYIKLANLLVV